MPLVNQDVDLDQVLGGFRVADSPTHGIGQHQLLLQSPSSFDGVGLGGLPMVGGALIGPALVKPGGLVEMIAHHSLAFRPAAMISTLPGTHHEAGPAIHGGREPALDGHGSQVIITAAVVPGLANDLASVKPCHVISDRPLATRRAGERDGIAMLGGHPLDLSCCVSAKLAPSESLVNRFSAVDQPIGHDVFPACQPPAVIQGQVEVAAWKDLPVGTVIRDVVVDPAIHGSKAWVPLWQPLGCHMLVDT